MAGSKSKSGIVGRSFFLGGAFATAVYSAGIYARWGLDKNTAKADSTADTRPVSVDSLEACNDAPQQITRHIVNAKSKDGVGFTVTLYAESKDAILRRDNLVQSSVSHVIGAYKAKELEAGNSIPKMGFSVGPNMKDVTVNVRPAKGLKAAFDKEIAIARIRSGERKDAPPLTVDIRGEMSVKAERNTFQKAVVADMPSPPRLER